jgi:hypothetical protein
VLRPNNTQQNTTKKPPFLNKIVYVVVCVL